MKPSPKAGEWVVRVPVSDPRLAGAAAAWHCYSNFLTCRPDAAQGEHLLKYHETGYRADLRRLEGHAFFECRQCSPTTYIFAVFVNRPSPMATCYQISKESFDQWDKDPNGDTFSTPEMLYRLTDPQGRSLNPTWRPPR